ncbi:uncharacterized protein LOC142630812 [Castanea sativa]|uniref:uncharacterized protein LOC142630812 n=1 Tax=Castanea sativa TaxID=21020 RepID=UPI003F64FC45
MDGKSVGMVAFQEPLSWKVYVNGAANQRGSGVNLVITSPEMIIIEKSLRLGFSATNNEAKYEVLLAGMTIVQNLRGKVVEMFSNSRLVVGQVEGELKARDSRMQQDLNQVRHLQSKFESFTLLQVPRSKNTHVDSLATLATSSTQGLPRVILVEDLYKPTKAKGGITRIHQIRAGPSWMDPIVLFLKEDILPEEKSETNNVRRKAPRFWLSEDQKLYKRSFSIPYLLCIHPKVTELLLEELHEGICGSHTGGRSLSHRALTQGYWWPNMQKEAQEDLDAKRFVLKNIVSGFGISHTLISDNGLQFDSKAFRRYCCDLSITNKYSTPAYPQGNGQAEAVNKVIVNRLKKRSTRESSFSMTYRAETVILLETGFPTLRMNSFTPSSNNGLLERSLDLIEERRENTMFSWHTISISQTRL